VEITFPLLFTYYVTHAEITEGDFITDWATPLKCAVLLGGGGLLTLHLRMSSSITSSYLNPLNRERYSISAVVSTTAMRHQYWVQNESIRYYFVICVSLLSSFITAHILIGLNVQIIGLFICFLPISFPCFSPHAVLCLVGHSVPYLFTSLGKCIPWFLLYINGVLTDGGEVVSPTRQPLFTPRKIPGTHFC
jgi:hypothetical protein